MKRLTLLTLLASALVSLVLSAVNCPSVAMVTPMEASEVTLSPNVERSCCCSDRTMASPVSAEELPAVPCLPGVNAVTVFIVLSTLL